MASSLPLVVTDIGGNREAVKNETNGYLVNVGDIDNIAKKLNILISDKKKRQEFGRKSYKIISDNFLLEKQINEYDSLYKKVF